MVLPFCACVTEYKSATSPDGNVQQRTRSCYTVPLWFANALEAKMANEYEDWLQGAQIIADPSLFFRTCSPLPHPDYPPIYDVNPNNPPDYRSPRYPLWCKTCRNDSYRNFRNSTGRIVIDGLYGKATNQSSWCDEWVRVPPGQTYPPSNNQVTDSSCDCTSTSGGVLVNVTTKTSILSQERKVEPISVRFYIDWEEDTGYRCGPEIGPPYNYPNGPPPPEERWEAKSELVAEHHFDLEVEKIVWLEETIFEYANDHVCLGPINVYS